MFSQDFRRDFDVVLRETEPFALVRFGDGEIALLDGVPHVSSDPWRVSGSTWLRAALAETLTASLDRYCLGLPGSCCIKGGYELRQRVRVPRAQLTIATLFMHGNRGRIGELFERFRSAVVVSSWMGDIRVPANGVNEAWDVDAVVAQLRDVDRPVLLAAGPCSNLIAHRYWRDQPKDRRQIILDVGSALDCLHGRVSRHYDGAGHFMRQHFCVWEPVTRETRARTSVGVVRERIRLGNRIKVGRRT